MAQPAARLERAFAGYFRTQGRRFLLSFGQLRSRFAEALTPDDWWQLFDQATKSTREGATGALGSAIEISLVAGARNAMGSVGVDVAFDLRNPRAEAYLQEHGYGLITRIDEVTRGRIGGIIEQGTREGWAYNRMAKEISAMYSEMAVGRPQAHIDSRAHLIAVTETGNAYETGNAFVIRDLQDAGLPMEKFWLTVGDDRVSTGCYGNQSEGWIPFEQAHSSGHMHPLRFPGCRCTELYQRRQ